MHAGMAVLPRIRLSGSEMFSENKTQCFIGNNCCCYNFVVQMSATAPHLCSSKLNFFRNTNSSNSRRVKRSAYWFLGEYCCQLTGSPSPAYTDPPYSSPQRVDQSPPSKPNPGGGDDLLDVWGLPAPKGGGEAARPAAAAGLNGLEAGARAVAHPVVSAMNGATVSMMMRLKHAAMFEDFQVR